MEKYLEDIDKQINDIQVSRTKYKTNWRNRMFSLLFFALLAELVFVLVFWFYLKNLTKDPVEQGIYATPLLLWIMMYVITV